MCTESSYHAFSKNHKECKGGRQGEMFKLLSIPEIMSLHA